MALETFIDHANGNSMIKHTIGGIELTKRGAKILLYEILHDAPISKLTNEEVAICTFLEDDAQVQEHVAKKAAEENKKQEG